MEDGNVQVVDSDPLPAIAGQMLVRTYDSQEQVAALFGQGWTTLFARRMILDTQGAEKVVSLVTPTNQMVISLQTRSGSQKQLIVPSRCTWRYVLETTHDVWSLGLDRL